MKQILVGQEEKQLPTKAVKQSLKTTDDYDEEYAGKEIKPEYLRKLRKSSAQPGKHFKNVAELRKYLEKL